MPARLSHDDPIAHTTPLLAVAVFEDDAEIPPPTARIDALIDGAFGRAMAAGDMSGREEESVLFYRMDDGEGPSRVAFIGVGTRTDADPDALRRFAARAVRIAEKLRITEISVVAPTDVSGVEGGVKAVAEGALLAAWDFRELKTVVGADEDVPPPPPLVAGVTIIAPGEEGSERGLRFGRAFAAGQNLARDLQWRPGNVATPTHLAEVAEELAAEFGFVSRILGPEEMRLEGMKALLAVSAGSDQEPRLIVLEHRGGSDGDPPLALVGKGLTFDTGGISIKPAQGMEDMKYDMSGGAAVLGAMRAIGELDLPINVVAVVPSSENLVSGSATKPGDVIGSRAGKTIEVINTDAEGRLILADALSYTVDEFAPAAMVDLATLTGACVIALGHHAAAVLGTDDDLVGELRAAGDRAAERCWPLPLWTPYRRQLDSPVADLKNVGGRPAGTITAAHFLAEFVGESSWAHLDIAGTAYGDPTAPYQRKGGFGFPTRLLLEWVVSRAG